jgi:hypothetical protein
MGLYNNRRLVYLVKLGSAPAVPPLSLPLCAALLPPLLYYQLAVVDNEELMATEYYKARADTFLDTYSDIMALVPEAPCALQLADQERLASILANPALDVVLHGWYDVNTVWTTYDDPAKSYAPRIIEDGSSFPESEWRTRIQAASETSLASA